MVIEPLPLSELCLQEAWHLSGNVKRPGPLNRHHFLISLRFNTDSALFSLYVGQAKKLIGILSHYSEFFKVNYKLIFSWLFLI